MWLHLQNSSLKDAVTKTHIVNSVYRNRTEQANPRRQRRIGVPRDWGDAGKFGVMFRGTDFPSEVCEGSQRAVDGHTVLYRFRTSLNCER